MAPVLLALLLLLPWPFFFVFSSRRSTVRPTKPKLPPGPFKLPLLGNLPQMISLTHRSLGALSRRHGPLMHLRVGRTVFVVASSAATAREILKTHDSVFASRPLFTAANQLLYGSKDVIFAPYGEHWREARRVCVVHLLSTKRVQSYGSVREDEVVSTMESVSQQSSTGPVNLGALLRVFTSGVVSRVALGKKYSERRQIIDEVTDLLGELFVEDFFPRLAWVSRAMGKHDRLRRCFGEVDSFLDEVIEGHSSGAHRRGGDDADGDLVDILLSLQKDEQAGRIFQHRDCIKAIILDMFGAGTETSASTVEWTMSELIRNPEAMRKAQHEVRAVAGAKAMVAESDLEQMDYVKAAIKEALRLHPPVPLLVPRESVREAEVAGFHIPAGARILVNVWAIGRDPNSWEAPEEFMPERFLDSSADDAGRDFKFLPFGGGRRVCAGIAFANSAVELVLANLLHRFDWKLPQGMSSEDLDMAEGAGIAAPRKNSLQLVAVPRAITAGRLSV